MRKPNPLFVALLATAVATSVAVAQGTTVGPVSVGPVVVTGPIDKAKAQEVLKRRLSEVRYCNDREVAKHDAKGRPRGDLTVHLAVATTGLVTEATVARTTIQNASFEQCVLKNTRRWTFTKPKTAATVDFTITIK